MEKRMRYMTVGLMLVVMAAYYGLSTGDYIFGAIFTIMGALCVYWSKTKIPFDR